MEERIDYFKCKKCGILTNPKTRRAVGKGKPLKPTPTCPKCGKIMEEITKEEFEKKVKKKEFIGEDESVNITINK